MQESSQQTPRGHDEIAAAAYQIWEKNGRPAGRDVEFWLQAEQSLNHHAASEPAAATPAALTNEAQPRAPLFDKAPVRRGRKSRL